MLPLYADVFRVCAGSVARSRRVQGKRADNQAHFALSAVRRQRIRSRSAERGNRFFQKPSYRRGVCFYGFCRRCRVGRVRVFFFSARIRTRRGGKKRKARNERPDAFFAQSGSILSNKNIAFDARKVPFSSDVFQLCAGSVGKIRRDKGILVDFEAHFAL